MKLLFYRYGSICEPDIIATFLEFGFEVNEITEEITNKNFTPEEGVKLVSAALLNTPCDFVFSINFYPFLAEVCNIMHLRYLCWIVDSPILELYSPAIRHPWNRIFLFDRVLYQEISPLNPDCVFYLPLAVNTMQKKNTIATANSIQRQKYLSDISFVGSLYSEKCLYNQLKNPPAYLEGYLSGLMESQLKVYGYYFIDELLDDKMVADFKTHVPDFLTLPYANEQTDLAVVSQYYIASKITSLERERMLCALSEQFSVDLYTGSSISALPAIHPKGFAKTLTEMPLIFHESRINLNMTAKSIRSALPLRIWDILGCGGFLLTNYQSEIPEYFTIGEELETYGSKDELLEKCSYYLEHENKRAEIAAAGFEKVQKYHTYPIRLSKLMELAFL